MALDFRAGFGDYAQCTVRNTDRSMESRTEDCIVMLPTGNRTGSVKVLSIKTGKLESRDQFKLLPMPSTVITRLNDMAAREGRKIVTRTNMVYDLERGLRSMDDPTYMQPTENLTVNPADIIDGYTAIDLANNAEVHANEDQDYEFQPAEESSNGVTEPNVIIYHDAPGFDRDSLDVGPLIEFEEQEPVAQLSGTNYDSPMRLSASADVPFTPARSGSSTESGRAPSTGIISRPLRRDLMSYYKTNDYAMNISVKEALRSRGAQRVITKELAQMIQERVWTPVHMSSLSSTEKSGIIRSQMFLKEKYLPTGAFEKLKARLVAGGN